MSIGPKVRVAVALAGAGLLALTAASLAAQSEEAMEKVRRGIELLQQGQADQALEQFEEAIEEEPGFAAGHYYAGMALGTLQRHGDAYERFVQAAELDPGNGEAHKMACISAFHAGHYEDSWQQAILAAQAGVDMGQAFLELEAVSDRPADLDARLAAPRVFVREVDLSRLAASDAEPGEYEAASRRIAEASANIYQIRTQLGLALLRSPNFAVVKVPEAARYHLVVEADEFVGTEETGVGPLGLNGYLKLVDPESDNTEYSRRLVLPNITSVADLNRELTEAVTYLEGWLQR